MNYPATEAEARANAAIVDLRRRITDGLPMREVSKAIGRKNKTIAMWLAGLNRPRGKVLARLERYLA